jgi:N utilization substance protein B
MERTFAFKVLYGLSFAHEPTEGELAAAFARSPDRPEGMAERGGYAWDLCKGVWQNRHALDRTIAGLSQNWRLERMGKVEVTLLRIALFEMRSYNPDVPPKVAINEALELSKQFGDDKSRGFVNGVLDAAIKALEEGRLGIN